MTTSTMTAAARLAAKLLAHRQTPQEEVGDLIRHVHGALARLSESPTADSPAASEAEMSEGVPAPRRKRRARSVAVEAPETAPSEPSEPAAPAPKLIRRSDLAAAPPAAATPPMLAPPQSTVRGVVRWFDPKSGKGALRLTGLGDVPFEASLLAESGITRLFKGQEVEATVAAHGAASQVQHLSLPGTVTASPLGGGVVKTRHAKPVVVELKREALRRVAARAEAEHVLGSTRR